MDWRDFYKFPLRMDSYCGNVLAQPDASGYMMAWDWVENEYISEYPVEGERGDILARQIVSYVNGEGVERPNFEWSISESDPVVIRMDGIDCIEVRGWGNISSVVINQEKSAKIQDGFIYWLVDRLNGKV